MMILKILSKIELGRCLLSFSYQTYMVKDHYGGVHFKSAEIQYRVHKKKKK